MTFLCAVCGQLSDDGDLQMRQCMSCSDALCDRKLRSGYFVRVDNWFFCNTNRWSASLNDAFHFNEYEDAQYAAQHTDALRMKYGPLMIPEAMIVEVR